MCASHDVRRVPALVYAASGAYTRIGAVYAPPPDAAYTHMCLYDAVVGAFTRVGAYTRAVGAYTQRVRIRTRVRIRAGRCVYASGGCIDVRSALSQVEVPPRPPHTPHTTRVKARKTERARG